MLGRPGICEPVIMKVTPGAWLTASVLRASHDTKIIGQLSQVGQHGAHLGPALPVLFKRFDLRDAGPGFVIGRHGGEPGVPAHRSGDVLARHFGEHRLGVEEIDVGGAPALPQNDYAFGLGREVGKGKPGGAGPEQLIMFEQTGEGGQSDSG